MHQLRIYTIEPGRMDEFVAVFAEVARLRRDAGFEVIGPWIVADADQFVWIAGYDGPDDWDIAGRRYYESPERAALEPDPGSFIVSSDVRMMRSP